MNKVYVDVVAEFSKEGCLIPILFVWEDGRNLLGRAAGANDETRARCRDDVVQVHCGDFFSFLFLYSLDDCFYQ